MDSSEIELTFFFSISGEKKLRWQYMYKITIL